MRKTIALAGGFALLLTMASTVDAGTRSRSARPTGENPLVDVRQPQTLRIGNVHVALRDMDADGLHVAKTIELRAAAMRNGNIQKVLHEVSDPEESASPYAEKLALRLAERKSNVRVNAVSLD